MKPPDDTIVAAATPPGRGGIAIVRLSGGSARQVASSLLESPPVFSPRHAHLCRLRLLPDGSGGSVEDEALATFFPGPHSYTGEDVFELSVHGSPVLVGGVIEGACRAGARLAGRGEFTLRAFLNGRLDLAQAEAVGDLVAATSPLQARVAFDQLQGGLSERVRAIEELAFALAARLEAAVDFPDDAGGDGDSGVLLAALDEISSRLEAILGDAARGRLAREGARAVIVGRVNVGKSSVFNRLVGIDRAIVTPEGGTTRDLLTETVIIEGMSVTLADTAGIRAGRDAAEREGVRRAGRARDAADLVLLVLDGSAALVGEDVDLLAETRGRPRIVIANKRDLPAAWREAPPGVDAGDLVEVSAASGEGIDQLTRAIGRHLIDAEARPIPAVSNARHVGLLEKAQVRCQTLAEAVGRGSKLPDEVVLSALYGVREPLEEIVGKRTTEDLLEAIFSTFCVGK